MSTASEHLRLRVELNSSLPLTPGFHIPRTGKEPLWVSFKYERLVDYCNLCGLTGHKKFSCPTASSPLPLANIRNSLKAMASSSPRMVSAGISKASMPGVMFGEPTSARPATSDPGYSGGVSNQIAGLLLLNAQPDIGLNQYPN
jgi:hypothetical protein